MICWPALKRGQELFTEARGLFELEFYLFSYFTCWLHLRLQLRGSAGTCLNQGERGPERAFWEASAGTEIKPQILVEEGGKSKRKGVKNAREAFYSGGLGRRAAMQKAPGEESARAAGGKLLWLGSDKHICQRLLSTQGYLWDVPQGKKFLCEPPQNQLESGIWEKSLKLGFFLR